MYATDFIYDGEHLSDYHFVICSIDSDSSVTEISAGSDISFNQLPAMNGGKHSLISAKYESCITAQFDICKDPDYFNDLEIVETDHLKIIKWLNRKEFHKFNFITSYMRCCYYNASFNIKNIYVDDTLVGFRLTMVTDRPYGFTDDVSVSEKILRANDSFMIKNESDETGDVYPILNIKIYEKGNLSITNTTFDYDNPTIINNCEQNEEIVIDCENQIITSSEPKHICKDFNFKFFSLGSTRDIDINKIVVSLPCLITITYTPIVKNIN